MFGVSTYCLLEEPLNDALDRVSCITDFIEVMDEGPHFVTDASLFESYSGDFILHAPYHGINIACPFETIRRASVEVMIDCFSTASDIGARVVLHPGYFAWEQERELARRQFGKSLTELRDAANELSVTFYFENMGDMNFFNLRTPDDLVLIGDIGFALDVGHANLNHCLAGFLEVGISHMHIHDNDGRRDTHSPVGEGEINFLPVIAALQSNRSTSVIEVKTFSGVLKSIEVLERISPV